MKPLHCVVKIFPRLLGGHAIGDIVGTKFDNHDIRVLRDNAVYALESLKGRFAGEAVVDDIYIVAVSSELLLKQGGEAIRRRQVQPLYNTVTKGRDNACAKVTLHRNVNRDVEQRDKE